MAEVHGGRHWRGKQKFIARRLPSRRKRRNSRKTMGLGEKGKLLTGPKGKGTSSQTHSTLKAKKNAASTGGNQFPRKNQTKTKTKKKRRPCRADRRQAKGGEWSATSRTLGVGIKRPRLKGSR